ncbi:hypothetical protein C8A01DRAFT_14541 [Parachaetomium inaequale]|uniref:Transmembrane protein 42 n=1 Tax=Parachaetomium inaequale TaxID=2588326 RepID=A0AAN6PKM2_9PEZI|nr:hypothetical protein C8A01DRAFT_14541 [Parachaetomium inaequale]
MPTLRQRKRDSHQQALAAAPSSQSTASASSNLTKRVTPPSAKNEKQPADVVKMSPPSSSAEERPFLDSPRASGDGYVEMRSPEPEPASRSWAQRNQWIVFALASGACAAFNGVFAKLTMTELTTNFSQGIARMLGLEHVESVIEVIVRGSFFGLNLVFNGVMWTLFTTALARGDSTTQVSIMNTSANFVITAVLGFAIFSENLPPLWWLGAALLVAGNVIIGRKDEGKPEAKGEGEGGNDEAAALGSGDESELGGQRQRSGGSVDGADEGEYKDEDVADLRI